MSRYYIVEEDGSLSKTNDPVLAAHFSADEMMIVIDSEKDVQLIEGELETEIEEASSQESLEDEEPKED